MLRKTVISVVITMLAAVAALPTRADDAELYAAAKKEGSVVWYTSQVQNVLVHPLARAFEAKYPGVKVTIVGGKNTDLLLRILNEAKAGVHIADVSSPAGIAQLRQAGLLASYTPEAAKDYPAEFRGKDGTWTAMLTSVLGPVINTELVAPKDEPRSFDDFLAPRWKGKMAWAAYYDITTGPGFIETMLALMGREQGMAYVRKLAQQDIIKVPANQRVVLDQLIAGEFPLAFQMFQHQTMASIGKGAPLKWLEAGPFVSVTSSIALLKNAPHPNAGKLFVEFVLSEQGQTFVAGAGYPPARPGIKAKPGVLSGAVPGSKAMTVPPEESDAITEAGTRIYKDVFR